MVFVLPTAPDTPSRSASRGGSSRHIPQLEGSGHIRYFLVSLKLRAQPLARRLADPKPGCTHMRVRKCLPFSSAKELTTGTASRPLPGQAPKGSRCFLMPNCIALETELQNLC